jgi:potassium-dependent mechanosensitive channel
MPHSPDRCIIRAKAAQILMVVLAWVALCGLAVVAASAQDLDLIVAAEKQAAETRAALDRVASEIGDPALTPVVLSEKRQVLDAIKSATLSLVPRLQSASAEVGARRNELGPAPPAGTGEPVAIAAERKALSDLLGRYVAAEKQLTLMAVEADQLSARVARLQRDAFLQRIFEASRSILNPRLWIEGARAWSVVADRAGGLLQSWYLEARLKTSRAGLTAVLTAAAVLMLGSVALGRLLARKVSPALHAGGPTNFDRLWRPLWMLVIALLVFAFVLVGTIATLETAGIITPRFEGLITAGLNFFVNLVVVITFGRAILAPNHSQWRLPPIDDPTARRLGSLLAAGALVFALDELSSSLVQLLFLPFAFSVGQSAILTVAMIVILAGGLVILHRNRHEPPAGSASTTRGRKFYFGWAAYLAQPVWALLGVSALALLFGYVALGHFIVFQIVHTLLLVFIFYLLHHLVDEIVATSTQPRSAVGRFLRQRLSLSDRAVERIGVVFGAGADLAIILIGVPIIFLQWTINWIDFRSWLSKAWYGFEIAGTRIHLSSLLFAIVVLLIGIIVTKIITRWIDVRVLMRTHLDKGVRESVRKGVSYTGILLATVIALTSAGVEFSNIAIIAGALGVGIGFGLQSIVNNFVSGLILLAERPVKVGDWIVLGAGEGIVRRINVRSTEIDTFDRATIIVPNSNLVSEPVTNRTHGDTMGKGVIDVTVRSESDPDVVRDVLMHCAQSHAGVAHEPQAAVQLAGFGENALRFQLHFFVTDALTAAPTASDLRFAILKAFRAKGIELSQGLRDLFSQQASPVRPSRKA